MTFKVFTAASMTTTVFWDIASCCLVETSVHFIENARGSTQETVTFKEYVCEYPCKDRF
jgi:hypothetical protein